MIVRALILAAAMACLATQAQAHTRSQSLSRWTVEGDVVTAQVEAEAVDVTRLYVLGGEDQGLDAVFAAEVARAFQVEANGAACPPQGEPHARVALGGRVVATLSFVCPAGTLARDDLAIESRLFLDVAPSHLHFASWRAADGRSAEAVLTEAHPRADLRLENAAASRPLETVARFIGIGAEHVWSGLDHVAFILALTLLAAGRVRSLLLAATGFTLGHSITLGLAAFDVLRPDTVAIEALIGFTIAFVACELGARGPDRMRALSPGAAAVLALGGFGAWAGLLPMSPLIWFGLAAFVFAYDRGFPRGGLWLALIFGLIHGCGFAGALGDLDLPRARLLESLLGFNIGVELGQLVVIGAALVLGLAVQRLPARLAQHAAPIAGAALFGLGLYWFVGRLI